MGKVNVKVANKQKNKQKRKRFREESRKRRTKESLKQEFEASKACPQLFLMRWHTVLCASDVAGLSKHSTAEKHSFSLVCWNC